MKPTLRLIHHLQRTGGTLFSKCLASLPNVALLSEVNPRTSTGAMALDPVFQASFWLRLLNEETARRLADAPFADQIKAIHLAARNRGEDLIVRDWAYLDFFALPFADRATYSLSTAMALADDFELAQVVTVRHPMDQWLSWCKYAAARPKLGVFTFEAFVEACDEFRQKTEGIPRVRYEDFVARPTRIMRELCGHLELNFDPIFLRRWPHYHQITGDDQARVSKSISPRPRRVPGEELLAAALANDKYVRLLDAYGYS